MPTHGRMVQTRVCLSSLHRGFLLVIREEMPIPQLREHWLHSVVWLKHFLSFTWFHTVRWMTSHEITHQSTPALQCHFFLLRNIQQPVCLTWEAFMTAFAFPAAGFDFHAVAVQPVSCLLDPRPGQLSYRRCLRREIGSIVRFS